jgi:Cytidine and deoxycytidylate deaminase zinc-binding region
MPNVEQLVESFLSDPRTTRLADKHRTSVHMAIVVKRGKVIAQATNGLGSRSRGSGYSKYTIHAEKNVVKQLGDISKLRDADLYVMRFSKCDNPTFMGSKPCHECECFLQKCKREYGLRNVYYTTN